MNESRERTPTYVFGCSKGETERLQKLDQLLRPSTRRLLEEAGIGEGMKVLDVGCGPGSVALLIADLVGPAGWVVGIDRNSAMLETARARAGAAGQVNLSFVEADLGQLTLDVAFDAVVGRLVLLHLGDPVAVLRKLLQHVRPGGIVAFQEPDLARMGASYPPVPVLRQICDWVREAHRSVGADIEFGLRLHQVFLDAGLPAPRLRCDAFIGSGVAWGWYEAIVDAMRNAMPVVVSAGITTAEEIGIETLDERVHEAVVSQRSVTRAIDLVSAWTRKPPARAADQIRPHPGMMVPYGGAVDGGRIKA
jgi:SAM-dependent methyltransferase